MMNQKQTICIVPSPKHVEDRGTTAAILPRITAEPELAGVAEVFVGYFREMTACTVAVGEGGICLKWDAKLPEEGYCIDCSPEGIVALAATEKGMHNAMSVLLQMLSVQDEQLVYPCCRIEDEPDVPYRGLMMDTARYPHSMELLRKYVDLCYRNRASYLQIHFSDDQNFTVTLPDYPGVKGYTYSREELLALAEYAHRRGITIVPEIDIPGHSTCLTQAYPDVFGHYGVMSASETTFAALKGIYSYIHEVFPYSPYIHIGGDEANISEWEKCPVSQEYMKIHGITSIHELYAVYIQRVTEIIFELGCTPIVWEGFAKEYNHLISKDVIVIAWESLYQPAYDLAADGFQLINCSWEPLYVVTGDKYWSTEEIAAWNIRSWKNWFYKSLAYPDGFTLPKGSATILGGQLCAWGDRIYVAEDPEAMLEEEYRLVSERMPVLCERTWNTGE